MFNKFSYDKVNSFIKSLTYWENINLTTTLLQVSRNISYRKAKAEAILNYHNNEFLRHLLDEAINSPNTYNDSESRY